jgi:hypothetical protein
MSSSITTFLVETRRRLALAVMDMLAEHLPLNRQQVIHAALGQLVTQQRRSIVEPQLPIRSAA